MNGLYIARKNVLKLPLHIWCRNMEKCQNVAFANILLYIYGLYYIKFTFTIEYCIYFGSACMTLKISRKKNRLLSKTVDDFFLTLTFQNEKCSEDKHHCKVASLLGT